MRKRLMHGLGAFALVLGGPPAVGQEKPPVLPPDPVVELLRRFNVNVQAADFTRDLRIKLDRRMELHRALRLALQGGRVSAEDLVTVFMRSSRSFMPEVLELTVQELEKASEFDGGRVFAQGLAALDAAERAAMKARRSLAAWKESGERLAKDAEGGAT